MGLDSVELVIRIEEEFDTSISDEDAATIATPRQFIDYVMARPELSGTRSRDAVAESIWQVREEEIGVKRARFTENSSFIEDTGMD